MRATVIRSTSTWQQPVPAPASAARTALIRGTAARIAALGPGLLRVGVDGPTAAGKTTFGHELAEALAALGRPVLRATLDDFKKPWRDRHLYDRESGAGYYRNAFDLDRIVGRLLVPADAVTLCGIDPLTQLDHGAEGTPVPPGAALVVDGVFAFRPELDPHWDFRIRLVVPERTSIDRGAARDAAWAGAAAGEVHRTRYLPAERLYEAEVDPDARADLTINNTDVANPVVRADPGR